MRIVERTSATLRKEALPLLFGASVAVPILEFIFRHVLPASSNPASVQDPRDLILRFDTLGPLEGVRSDGPLARDPVRWRVNNEGWNSPRDYSARTSARPRIALLGDSYIEALYVDIDDHLESRLEDVLGPDVDVYAFGRSNWYLEQFIALARYVEERFAPDVYVIFLTSKDIWWSLREAGVKSPYLFQIGRVDEGFVEFPPADRLKRRWLQLLLRRSALACYVSNNLGVRSFLRRRRGPRFATMVGDAAVDGDGGQAGLSQRETARLLREATAFMLRRLVEDHPAKSFVFVDTSDSSAVYDGHAHPHCDLEHEVIREECRNHPECHYFDLWPVFVEDYARNRRRFESSYWHWNGHANEIIARGLAAFLIACGLVDAGDGRDG